LLRFARAVRRTVPALRGNGEICFIFISDREIARVNWRFLKHRGPTDVITFPYGPSGPGLPFGDIYISTDTAARQARRGGYPAYQELALLVVHGLLHLAGYEDDTDARRKRMFARQKQLLRRLAPRLAPPDFR
jgi:probable rRNA maturation factor